MKFDNIAHVSLLFDFYGKLLTKRQREVMELYYEENLTLAEIADEFEISRQGVHDLVKRCDKILEEYEAKLHLVEKFLSIKEKVHQINELLEDAKTDESQLIQDIRKISGEIIEEL